MKRNISICFFMQVICLATVYAAEYCNRNTDAASAIRISDLLRAPGKYESSVVEVVGIYVFAYPLSFIFGNVDDYVAARGNILNVTREIRLEMNQYRLRTSQGTSLTNAEFGPKAEGSIVRVKGRFHNRLFHGSSVVSVIDEI